MEKKFVFIGKLVKLAKINLTKLKYYSKIGLLPYLQFAKNKNRVYDLEKSRKRLAEIKKLKSAGYTLEMIKRELNKKPKIQNSNIKFRAKGRSASGGKSQAQNLKI